MRPDSSPVRAPGVVHTARVQLRDVGPRAVLVEVEDHLVAADLAAWVRRQHGPDQVGEVVPGARSVLLDGVPGGAWVRALLARWPGPSRPSPTSSATAVEVGVRLDGPDLAFVAQRWGTGAAGLAERLAGLDLVSAFCGFSPGFAYLAGLPEELGVPRLESPRPRVRPGAVALADRWCAVYPAASPGGWRVVGHTDAVLWDVERDPPALLAPGTRVRFVVR